MGASMPYKDKTHQRPAQMAAYHRKKARIRAQLVACMDCGLDDVRVLEWHHRPDEKFCFRLGKVGTQSEARIAAEIAKCDPLCANCHKIRHIPVAQ